MKTNREVEVKNYLDEFKQLVDKYPLVPKPPIEQLETKTVQVKFNSIELAWNKAIKQ